MFLVYYRKPQTDLEIAMNDDMYRIAQYHCDDDDQIIVISTLSAHIHNNIELCHVSINGDMYCVIDYFRKILEIISIRGHYKILYDWSDMHNIWIYKEKRICFKFSKLMSRKSGGRFARVQHGSYFNLYKLFTTLLRIYVLKPLTDLMTRR